LIGKSGTGKFTIATEIAKSGYKICDNQLINYSIFSLLNYDGFSLIPEYAWVAIRGIRENILGFLANEMSNNYILTNVLGEIERDYKIFDQVEQMAHKRGSIFVPVKLVISEEENIKRIQNKDRLVKFKSIDTADVYNQVLINIDHPNMLTLDASLLAKEEAASEILAHINKIRNKK
jgi:DUF438 domain-containing protein